MPPTVILSHSLRDEPWKNQLAVHLAVLERAGHLEALNEDHVRQDAGWPAQLSHDVTVARAVVLLLSKDYLASDLVRGRALPSLIARRRSLGAAAMAVVVRPCGWRKVPWLAAIQPTPSYGATVSELHRGQAEEALAQVAADILEAFSQEPFPGSLALRVAIARQRADRIFTPDGPVRDPRRLYGRDRLLDSILRLQSAGGARLVLYGPAGAGKTSLLKHVAAQQTCPVFFWSARAGSTFAGIARAMLESLAAETPRPGGGAHPGRGFHGQHSLGAQALATPDQVAAALGQREALVIVDGFGKIPSREQVEFIELIARLTDRPRLTLILAGDSRHEEHPSDLITNYHDVVPWIQGVAVPPLAPDNLGRIVDDGFGSLGIKVSPAARRFILKSGQARAVHRYCLDTVYILEERIRNGDSDDFRITTRECELAEAGRSTVG